MKALRHIIAVVVVAAVSAVSPTVCVSSDNIVVFVPESFTDVTTENATLTGARRGISMSVLSTTGKKIVVVGKIDNPSGVRMEITNNGRTAVKPVFYKGYFHAKVVLSLGVNQVDVRYRRDGGKWKVKSVPIFRSSRLEGGITSNYPPYMFHTDENERNCEGCHQMGLTQSEIETGLEKNCLACHSAITENVFVHGPVAVGICTICHDPESSPNRYKVNDTDDILCYGCHTDRKDIDDGKALLHGPVGAGLCTICHDAHSSPFEFQLVKSKSEICVLCHQEDYDRWIKEESLHPPFKKGDCAGCHDPHSADVVYNLKASRKDVCALCHEIPVPGHLHPVGKKPLSTLPDNFPLDEEGQTMCLTCHDPHGAQGPSLTRGIGCDGCHPK